MSLKGESHGLRLADPSSFRRGIQGIRRVMFAVDDIDAVVARMRAHGAELIGEMQHEDTYRLAYIRGPEGIIVALAEQLGSGVPGSKPDSGWPPSVAS